MIEPLTKLGITYYLRVRELERLCARQQETIQRQAARLQRTRSEKRAVSAEIQRLQARIRILEERLGRNSTNLSQPPSADGPGVFRPAQRDKRKGWRGGRRGHVGRSRPLVPLEQVDVIVECKPGQCRACQHPLTGEYPHLWRQQVSEIPEPRIEVTEYRRHRRQCPRCRQMTIGDLPEGVSQSRFGLRLHALGALLTGRFLLSKRDVVQLYSFEFLVQGWAANVRDSTPPSFYPTT